MKSLLRKLGLLRLEFRIISAIQNTHASVIPNEVPVLSDHTCCQQTSRVMQRLEQAAHGRREGLREIAQAEVTSSPALAPSGGADRRSPRCFGGECVHRSC